MQGKQLQSNTMHDRCILWQACGRQRNLDDVHWQRGVGRGL